MKDGSEVLNNEEINNEQDDNTKRTKKPVIIAGLVGALIALILVFSFSSYKLLFSPKKASFLSYLTTDIDNLKDVVGKLKENKLIKLLLEDNKAIAFDIEDTTNLSGTINLNKDFFALKFNNTNSYLLLENENLNEFWSKMDLENYELPSQINFDSYSFSKNEKRKIYKFITKLAYNVINNLESENFVLTTENSMIIADEEEKFRSIEMQLSEKDLFMLQKEVLVAFEKEGMLDLLISKLSNLETSKKIDKQSLKDELDKYVAYLDYAKAYYDMQNQGNEYFIIYRMYFDEKNNIVAREIVEKYDYEGETYEDIICRLITDSNEFYEIKLFGQEEYSSAYYNVISDKVTVSDKKQEHLITYSLEGFYVGYSDETEKYEYVPINSETTHKLIIENVDNNVTKVSLTDDSTSYNLNMKYDEKRVNIEFINDVLKANAELTNSYITKNDLINAGAIVLNNKTKEEVNAEINDIKAKFPVK